MTRRAVPLAAILLAGCAVGPNYARSDTPVPPAFAEPHAATGVTDAELASWWSGFGDPKLDELVNRAVAQNLDVESAAARIREVRAEERVAAAAAAPQVSATGSVTRQRISEHAIPAPPGGGNSGGGAPGGFAAPGTEFTTWRAGFDASWELDLFGKTKRSVEAAQARTGAAVWNLRDVQVSTAAEVASAYLQLRTLQQRMAVAEAEVQRQERALRLVQARTRGGLVTGQDLEQQKSSLASARAALPPLAAEADAQIHKIGVLTGSPPESLIADLSPAGIGASSPSPPQVPAGLPSDLLRRRPDIRAAERNLAAATANIGVATAGLYPRFSLSAAPALVSTALATLLQWGSRALTAGAAVDWPIFNGGRTRANIAVTNARQEQALIAYRKTILTALQDVEDALSAVDGDRRRAARLDASLGSARRAEEIARARYRGGLVTYSDVLQAQATRISLEDQVIETNGALSRDTVALYKALGGGWPEMAQGAAQP
jgi:NodT family efflux transporter outer membrane factor (OMF) lipoprotein